MNINFNKAALDLEGKEQKDSAGSVVMLGRILAQAMVNQSRGDALKYYDWGKKLYAGDPLNLDRSDIKTIKEFLEPNEQLTVLAKAQILEILTEGKD